MSENEDLSSVGPVMKMNRPAPTREEKMDDAHSAMRTILLDLEANDLGESPLANHLRGMVEAYLHGGGYR